MSKQALPEELAKRLNAFSIDPADCVIIGHDTADGPEHVLYDERANAPVDEGMVRQMVKRGWTHGAIEVRRNGPRIEVIVGRQRVKAARYANVRRTEEGLAPLRVRAFEKKADGADALEILITENEHRQGDRPEQKAAKCRRLLELGRTEEEAAAAFGVGVQTIQTWMKFFDLHEDVRRAVTGGELAFSAAVQLAELPREEQSDVLADAIEVADPEQEGEKTIGAPSARAVKAAVRRRAEPDSEGPAERPSIGDIRRVLRKHDKDPFLCEDFELALRWVLGEVSGKTIKGIVGALKK